MNCSLLTTHVAGSTRILCSVWPRAFCRYGVARNERNDICFLVDRSLVWRVFLPFLNSICYKSWNQVANGPLCGQNPGIRFLKWWLNIAVSLVILVSFGIFNLNQSWQPPHPPLDWAWTTTGIATGVLVASRAQLSLPYFDMQNGMNPTTARYHGMVYRCAGCVALLVDTYWAKSVFGVPPLVQKILRPAWSSAIYWAGNIG